MFGFVLSRGRAHRLLLAAALLTVLLSTSVLVTLSAFAATTGDTGVRRSLEHRSAPRTVLHAESGVTAKSRDETDRRVRAAARRAFDGLPTRIETATWSGAYALPRALRPEEALPGEDPDLTLFASLDRDRVRLTSGSWPGSGGEHAAAGEKTIRVPVAVPRTVAERLGLRTGDELALTSRLHGPPPVRAEITGVYVPRDRDAPYWRLDPLGGKGVRSLSFTTYGPLAVADDVFTGSRLEPAETHWMADADFSAVTTSAIGPLGDHLRRSVAHIGDAPGMGGVVASSELPALVDDLERSLLVGRSTLLIAALQLVVLAGLALLLVAQLLVGERAVETALLRARGGSRARLIALSATEALLMAVPGALLAPLIAGPVVSALLAGGALAHAGAAPDVRVPGTAWWVAAGTALACGLTVAAPALRRPADTTLRTGRRRAAALLRGGFDLALVVVAGVAFWQLQSRAGGTGVLTADGGGGGAGGLGVDPVLVTAPALALLAGTVVALRLLPLVARLGERRAARGRGLTAALAGWQLSRSPMRGAGPALLLVLAVAMGVFAVGQGASWDRSQADQAAFRTGGDLTVRGSTAPPFGQGGLFDGVEGVEAVAPVARDAFTVHGDRTAQVLATDTRAAADMLHVREDLSDAPLPGLLRPLAPRDASTGAGLRLPEDTRELRLTVRLESVDGGGAGEMDTKDSLTVTLEDRFGVPYVFLVDDLAADGRARTLTAGLTLAAGGTGGAPAGPLRLTRITVSHIAPVQSVERRLTLTAVESVGADGAARAVGADDGLDWSTGITAADSQGDLGKGRYDVPRVRSVRAGAADSVLAMRYATGSAPGPPSFSQPAVPVDISLRAGGPASPGEQAPLPAVATDAFLAASGAKTGDSVKAQISGTELTVRITGSLEALPTTGPRPGRAGTGSAAADTAEPAAGTTPDGGALLLDLAALDEHLQDAGAEPLEPEEWWVDARHGASGQVAEELRGSPALEDVVARDEIAAQLRGDPLSAGPRTALTAIAVAAAVLAAAGFAVSTAGTVRERTGEFAVLRALGAPRRRMAQVLATEQGLVVLMSLAVGLLLGVLLTRLVVPLIVLTGEGTRPVPDLLVQLPAGRLVVLVGAVLLTPLLVIAATALRGADPVTALRTERGD